MIRKFLRGLNVSLLLLIIISTFSSCANEMNIFGENNNEQINFSVSVPEWKDTDSLATTKISRATPITDISLSTSNTFNIIADQNDGAGNYSTLINSQAVTYTNNIWKTSNDYYWSGTANKTMNFYAYYPTGIFTNISHTAGIAPTLSYTVPDKVSEQIDIMIATGNNVNGNTNSSTSLTFNHIFAAVQFNIASSGMPNGTITGIALNNILCKGTYNFNGTWTQDATTKKSFLQTVLSSTSGGTAITSGATTFMIMPQTLASDASITVTYSNGGTLTKSISGTWSAGNIYTYSVSYAPRTFDYTGGVQTYTAPVTGTYKLEVWGAQGGSTGALGGYSYGNINLKIGESLFICIGGAGSDYNGNTGGLGGYNGGGNGGNGSTDIIAYGGCGGGGATHISVSNRGTLDNFALNKSDILLVSGGGGGASSVYTDLKNSPSGGGLNGGSATANDRNSTISGGTQNSGYSFGKGQNGASKSKWEGYGAEGNGGGGGGWYGGYAYQGVGVNSCCCGAGGSGYIGGVSYGSMQNGVRSGNGYARITFVSAN